MTTLERLINTQGNGTLSVRRHNWPVEMTLEVHVENGRPHDFSKLVLDAIGRFRYVETMEPLLAAEADWEAAT